MQYHYVYRTINLLTGHFYFGVHTTKNLNDGYLGSGSRLLRAIKKYGKRAFRCEALQFFKTREEAYRYEKRLIAPWLGHVLCYNLHEGGHGGWGHVKPECKARDQGGERNVNYGTCWIVNDRGQLCTKVQLQDLDDWLRSDEWRRGRVMRYHYVRASLLGLPE